MAQVETIDVDQMAESKVEQEEKEPARKSVQMSNGQSIPALGFGTWLSAPDVVGNAVKVALEAGYTHIDCAHCYGNEVEIGDYMTKTWNEGKLKREDVFVTSKLWVKDLNKDRVEKACQLTLKNLQLEHLDLYLTHLPFELSPELSTAIPLSKDDRKYIVGYDADKFFEVWSAMEKLVEKGLVKSIGVSNMTCKKLTDLLDRKPNILPACNQVELHLYLPQPKLQELCKANGIALVAYSPLGTPGFASESSPVLLSDEAVARVATRNGCTPAQVLLAWGIAQGFSVLAKSTHSHRILENRQAEQISLSADDLSELSAIPTRHRYLLQDWALKEGEKAEDLWDGEML